MPRGQAEERLRAQAMARDGQRPREAPLRGRTGSPEPAAAFQRCQQRALSSLLHSAELCATTAALSKEKQLSRLSPHLPRQAHSWRACVTRQKTKLTTPNRAFS